MEEKGEHQPRMLKMEVMVLLGLLVRMVAEDEILDQLILSVMFPQMDPLARMALQDKVEAEAEELIVAIAMGVQEAEEDPAPEEEEEHQEEQAAMDRSGSGYTHQLQMCITIISKHQREVWEEQAEQADQVDSVE